MKCGSKPVISFFLATCKPQVPGFDAYVLLSSSMSALDPEQWPALLCVIHHLSLSLGEVSDNCHWLFCLQYEKHEEKVDPAHAHRHHVEAQMAEAAALGLGGYALHEHHAANKIHHQENAYGQGSGHHHGHHKHEKHHHGHHRH